MTHTDSDLTRIPEARLDRLTVEELVRILIMGRESEDQADKRRARTAMRALLALEFDRVRGLVATFRFPGHEQVRIAAEDIDDVVQEALERILAMLENFEGTSVGEYRAALRTTVSFALMDFSRRKMNREKHLAGSIDEPSLGEAGEQSGRFEALLGELASAIEEHRTEAVDELGAVAAAFEKIPSGDMREVLQRTWRGYPSKEIAREMGLTPANVDQLRSRGMRKLREIMEADGG